MTTSFEQKREQRRPGPGAPAASHLDFIRRRTEGALQSDLLPSVVEPSTRRLVDDVRSTQRQIELEQSRLRAAQLRLESKPAPESLQVLLDIGHQLLDLLESRLQRLAAGRRWVAGWCTAMQRLAAQDQLAKTDLDSLVQDSRTLASAGIPDIWQSLSELLNATVRAHAGTARTSAELMAQTGIDALAGSVLTAVHVAQLPGRNEMWNDAILASALRDVGWLSMQSYLRPNHNRRVLWMYQQHPQVGRAMLGAVSGISAALLEIVALHHERCDGLGLSRRSRTSQATPARLVSVVSRLVDLTRFVPHAEVAPTLLSEADAGWWDREQVERVVWTPTAAASPAEANLGWVPVRVLRDPRTVAPVRELHGEHTALQGLHTAKPHAENQAVQPHPSGSVPNPRHHG